MRILLDECVNAGVKAAFPGHAVKTVAEIGWGGTKDAPLLEHAQKSFDVFVTIDRNLERHVNPAKLKLGIIIAHVASNEICSYQSIFTALLDAATNIRAGEILYVHAGNRQSRS